MSNINTKPLHKAQLGRNGFDLSMRRKFTSSVGQILPVFQTLLLPGDKITFNVQMFTRTQPLNTAAMVGCSEHVDLFFVPMTQLYSLFDNWYYNINDVGSSMFDPTRVPQTVPYTTYKELRKLPFDIQTWYANNTSSSLTTALPSGYTYDVDEMGVYNFANGIRLMDLFGYPLYESPGLTPPVNPVESPHVNLWYPAAYQKIFMDYYRLSDFHNLDNTYYNLDQFYDAGEVQGSDVYKMFKLRYHKWKSDYFTNIQNQPIFNPTSSGLSSLGVTPSTSGGSSATNPGGFNKILLSNTEPSTNSAYNPNASVTVGSRWPFNGNTFAYTSVNSIREAFAYDKLLRITQMAGKHVDSQTLAHFGISIPQGVGNEVYHIGSFHNNIQINEVVSTFGDDESNPLGTIAGRGYGASSGNDLHFTAPDHGVLMACFYMTPDADYDQTGENPMVSKLLPYDYYQPEFDRLGMQPFTYSEIYFNTEAVSAIYGWKYRYSEYKQNYDVVNGGFSHYLNGLLRSWTAVRNDQLFTKGYLPSYASGNPYLSTLYINPQYFNSVFVGQFPTVTTKSKGSIARYFAGSTSTLNPATIFEFDNFLHSFSFKCFKTSCMSTYGLPNLNALT